MIIQYFEIVKKIVVCLININVIKHCVPSMRVQRGV